MPKGVYKRTPEHGIAISEGQKGVPKSPEHCAAMRVPKSPRTPEHCAAISAGTKGVPRTSEAQLAADKAHGDAQRGGNDIVNHHYLYDHSDLTKNTVKMTRSDHSRLHWLLWKLGVYIPHINVNEDN